LIKKALATCFAALTGGYRLERDPVTRPYPSHAGSYLADLTYALMTEDAAMGADVKRSGAKNVPRRRIGMGHMQIRATDPDEPHGDTQIPRRKGTKRSVLHA
jgi:hypothetical protein